MNPTRRFLFATAALLLAASPSFAQSLAGVVRDPAGKPVAGAVVAAVPLAASDPEATPNVLRTGAGGRYRFEHLPPGKYAVTVTARGLVAAFVPLRDVAAGETTADATLANEGGHTVSGRALDAAGKPRAVRIVASRYSMDEGDVFFAETGANGRYELRLPEADYGLSARAPGTYGVSERVPLHADAVRDLHFERTFDAPPAEALAWIRKAAIPLKTAEPGALDDLAPLAAVVGKARVVALGEATHGTREFFQLKHRTIQFLVEKMGFTVFGIEATMPGTMVVNDYVVDGKGSATDALNAMQFWTWNTDEVRALIEWMRAWNASHERKVKFLGFDMQDPSGALAYVLRYLEPRDAAYAATVPPAFAPLQTRLEYGKKSEAEKQQVAAAIETLAKHVDAQSPHDREWELVRRMVEVLRQGEEQSRVGFASQIRDRAMAENAQWILAHEPAGTKMVLWAHNGHVSAEPAPFFVNGSMGSHLRRMFGDELVIIGFAFNRGNFRAVQSGGEKRGLSSDNHLDAGAAGSFDAALASAGLPLMLLDLRTARGVAREWVDSALQMRGVGAVFDPKRPANFTTIAHPLRSYDAVFFVENMTAAHGHDRPLPSGAPPPPPSAPAAAAVNLDFEQGTAGELPAGWKAAGTPNGGFQTQLVADGCATGRCAELSHPEPDGGSNVFGVFMQRIDAKPYRGKRVRLRAKVRSELNGAASSAHLWMRVDRPGGELGFFDNMGERMPHALPNWTELSIEGDVAADADAIAFGALFVGSGHAWYDDFVLEVRP